MPRILVFALLFALTGCQLDSTAPAPTTGKTNWQQVGFEDAVSGAVAKDSSTLAANYNAVKPNREAYLKGYASGQQKICRPDFLYTWGVNGKLFPASCDGVDQATQLRAAWQRGMDQGAHDALINR